MDKIRSKAHLASTFELLVCIISGIASLGCLGAYLSGAVAANDAGFGMIFIAIILYALLALAIVIVPIFVVTLVSLILNKIFAGENKNIIKAQPYFIVMALIYFAMAVAVIVLALTSKTGETGGNLSEMLGGIVALAGVFVLLSLLKLSVSTAISKYKKNPEAYDKGNVKTSQNKYMPNSNGQSNNNVNYQNGGAQQNGYQNGQPQQYNGGTQSNNQNGVQPNGNVNYQNNGQYPNNNPNNNGQQN